MIPADRCPPPRHTRRRAWLLAGFVLGVGALAWGGYHWGMRAMVATAIHGLREAGPVVFFGAMAVLPLFGVPLMPFTLAAGPAFAPTLGLGPVIALAIAAVGVNVAAAYGVASRALRPTFVRLAGFFGYQFPATPVNSWHLSAFVRLAPGLPFFAQSFILGVMQVPFGSYMLISVLVPAGYISGVVLLGDALWQGQGRATFFAASILVLAGTALHFLRRKRFAPPERVPAAADPAASPPRPCP